MIRPHCSSSHTLVFLSPLRFHTMHILVIWDYTPTALRITHEQDIFSCSALSNICIPVLSGESYRTDLFSPEGNSLGFPR